MTSCTINGEVNSSADVERELGNTVTAFAGLVQANAQAQANLESLGVEGPGPDLLGAVQGDYAALADEIKRRATRFTDHVAQQRDWIAANPDVAKTFYGTWMDPRNN